MRDAEALRHRTGATWTSLTWAEVGEQVRRRALGFRELLRPEAGVDEDVVPGELQPIPLLEREARNRHDELGAAAGPRTKDLHRVNV